MPLLQEEFSDEEDGQDEDLSAALATLRMQQEARTQDGGSKRSGQEAGGKGGSVGGVGGDGSTETAIRTQVSHRLQTKIFYQTACMRDCVDRQRYLHLWSRWVLGEIGATI